MNEYRSVTVNKYISIALSFCVLSCFIGASVMSEPAGVNESGIIGLIVGSLVGVVVAVALIPTIANQTATLELDTAGDLDTTEETLIGLWPLLIVLGVMLAILGYAL